MSSYFSVLSAGPDQQYAVVVTSGFCGVGVDVGALGVSVTGTGVEDSVGAGVEDSVGAGGVSV